MLSFKIQSPSFKIEDFLIVTKKWVWAKKVRKQTPSQIEFQVGSTFFPFFAQTHCSVTNHDPLLSIKITSNFSKTYIFSGGFYHPQIIPKPQMSYIVGNVREFVIFWLTQIFYFQTFVTEFFRLKKKYRKNHTKNVRGQSCLYAPKGPLW